MHDQLKPRRLLERVIRRTRRSVRRRPAPLDNLFGRPRLIDPIDRGYGWSRGLPIDRHYIERFLEQHAADIRGHVLEIGDRTYTRKFGDERVAVSDVLHAAAGNPEATIVADLTAADAVPNATFDCIILTQTLPFIYNAQAAVRELFRILKPCGVVLATVPGISQVIRKEMALWGDYWRFTSLSARRLFEQAFPARDVAVQAYGNVLTAAAFLYGLASQELTPGELEYRDSEYEVIVGVRAVKPGSSPNSTATA